MTKWVCTSCGFEIEEITPPKKCPVCDANKDAFEIMESSEKHEKGDVIGGDSDDEWEEEMEVEDDSD